MANRKDRVEGAVCRSLRVSRLGGGRGLVASAFGGGVLRGGGRACCAFGGGRDRRTGGGDRGCVGGAVFTKAAGAGLGEGEGGRGRGGGRGGDGERGWKAAGRIMSKVVTSAWPLW